MRFLKFFTMTLFLISLLGIAKGTSANPLASVPANLQACFPKQGLKSVKLVAATQYNGKNYYLYDLTVFYQPNEENFEIAFANEKQTIEEFQRTALVLDKIGCSVAVSPKLALRNSLTLFIPEPAARELALQDLKKAIAQYGSKEAVIAAYENLPQDGGTGPLIFFPEDVWAFQQMGMKLPRGSVVGKRWEDFGY